MKYAKILKILVVGTILSIALQLIGTDSFAAAPTLVWSRATADGIGESSPMPVNFGNSYDSIVFGSHDKKVYSLNSTNGNDMANWPQPTTNPIQSSPSSADVDHDGSADIFIGSGDAAGECAGGGLYRFKTDGSIVYKFIASDGGTSCPNPSIHSSAALGDITRDSVADATFGALGLKAWSINSVTAGVNSGWPFYWDDTQFASPALADADGDGLTDAIMAGDSSPGPPVDWRGGFVRALRGNGTEIWEYKINEIVRSSPSVGDIDGDGIPEVVFGAGNYYVNNGGASDATKIYALNIRTGQLKWSRDLGGQTLASPTLADFNGDGRLDVAMGTWGGDQPGRLFVMNGVNGSDMSGYPRSSIGGIVIGQLSTADLTGDGGQDLIVPTGGGVYAYDGTTGANLWGIRQGFASYQNTPLVRDIDGNGRLDVVIAGTKPDGTGVVDRYQFGVGDPARLGTNGWHMFRLDQRLTGSWTNPPLELSQPTGEAGKGYRMDTKDGGVFTFGEARYYGSANVYHPSTSIVTSMSTPGQGYWQVTSDGGIFSFGDAQFYGSANIYHPQQPIVTAMHTPSGNGYWLVTRDGGVFSFGDAAFHGSANIYHPTRPVVAAMATASGNGYWIVTDDGGIFSFGDAQFYGSANIYHPVNPVTGAITTASGNGYWLATSDGGIFSFGDAQFYGSANTYHPNQPVIGMSRSVSGGYWLATQDGGLFSFNANFYGSANVYNPNQPIVSIATQGY